MFGASGSQGMPGAAPAVAQLAAGQQLGVEPLQQLSVDLGGRHGAEGGLDVEPDQLVVALAGAVFVAGDFQPLADHLAHGDAGPRVLAFVDLALQPGERLLRRGPVRCGFLQPPGLAGQRIRPSVHDRPERAVRTLLDVSPRSPTTGGHAGTILCVRSQIRSHGADCGKPVVAFLQFRSGAPGRIRTCDTRFRSVPIRRICMSYL